MNLTPSFLTSALRASGHLPTGEVTAVEVAPDKPGVSVIIPLTLTYSPDTPTTAPTRMIYKTVGQREARFYQATVGNPNNLPIIRCHAVAPLEGTEDYYILMENLSATHNAHPPSMLPATRAHAEMIIDAMAHLHAHYWDSPRLALGFGSAHTEATLRAEAEETAQHFVAFADFLGDRLSPERRQIYARALRDYWPKQIARLNGNSILSGTKRSEVQSKDVVKNLTLIHDDPHLGNFLYPRDPARDGVRFIDWKSWSINPAPRDLAHMLCVFWFPTRRAQLQDDLLRRYHVCLQEGGVKDYSWDELWYDYRLSAIYYLFYPLWQFAHGGPDFGWWNHAERTMLAYQELHCEELL